MRVRGDRGLSYIGTALSAHWQYMSEQQKYVSYTQAAKYSGVSIRTLKQKTLEGKLPSYRFDGGNKNYVKIGDLEKLFVRVR